MALFLVFLLCVINHYGLVMDKDKIYIQMRTGEYIYRYLRNVTIENNRKKLLKITEVLFAVMKWVPTKTIGPPILLFLRKGPTMFF